VIFLKNTYQSIIPQKINARRNKKGLGLKPFILLREIYTNKNIHQYYLMKSTLLLITVPLFLSSGKERQIYETNIYIFTIFTGERIN